MIEQIKIGLSQTAIVLKFLRQFPQLIVYMVVVGLIRTQILSHIPYNSIVVHLVGDILFLWMASALLYRTESILLKAPISILTALRLPLKNSLYFMVSGACIGILSLLCLNALASFDSLAMQEFVNFILLAITTLLLACIAIVITFENKTIHNIITKPFKIMSWQPIALFTSYGLLTLFSFVIILLIFIIALILGSFGLINPANIMEASWIRVITLIIMTLVIAAFQTSVVLVCLSFYHDRRKIEQAETMIEIRSVWM